MENRIKTIANKINEVLTNIVDSNSADRIFDYGEFAGDGGVPDFTEMIAETGLTREQLLDYIDYAEKSADTSAEWYEIAQLLHCVFMAGFLQPANQTND